jgi:ABC-type lipopolysaccharide export system ATPase subunit
MKEIIKLIHISLEMLDRIIFKDISATVGRGEVIGLIGPMAAESPRYYKSYLDMYDLRDRLNGKITKAISF